MPAGPNGRPGVYQADMTSTSDASGSGVKWPPARTPTVAGLLTIRVLPLALVQSTSMPCGYVTLAIRAVADSNSVTPAAEGPVVTQTILVPSGVIKVLYELRELAGFRSEPVITCPRAPATPPRVHSTPSRLSIRLPGASVSSNRTSMTPLAGVIWNASVRPSAAQESGEPQGLSFPMTAAPGPTHCVFAPVAIVYKAIAGFTSSPLFALTTTASLLPSGDSATPSTQTRPGCTGIGSALSPAGRPSDDGCNTKNF